MALRTIRKDSDPVLRKKAVNVKNFSAGLLQLLDDMAETMLQAEGVGLAAPQVGISKRIIVYRQGDEIREIINPEITSREGEIVDVEGCLSLPGVYAEVSRWSYIEVRGVDREMRPLHVTAQEMLARILQHEIDHLEGILFTDKALKVLSHEEIKELSEKT